MNTTELFKRVTPSRIKNMMEDFQRTAERFAVDPHAITAEGNPLRRAVIDLLNEARRIQGDDQEMYGHFMRGMAAGFYGLVRLAEAEDLEESLRPRLAGTAEVQDENQGPSPTEKESEMTSRHEFTLRDLADFFDSEGLNYATRSQDGLITASFEGFERGPVRMIARVDAERHVLGLHFLLPMSVPEQRRSEIAQAVARANYGMILGGFETDLRDGELSFKLVLPTDDGSFSQTQLQHCTGVAGAAIRHYLPLFEQVAFADVSAAKAMEERHSAAEAA